jgi:hypothetical protein
LGQYDLLNWVSFPSSVKLISDRYDRSFPEGMDWWPVFPPKGFTVNPGSKLRIAFKGKQQDVSHVKNSHAAFYGYDTDENRWAWLFNVEMPYGTFDWGNFGWSTTVPPAITSIRLGLAGGAGTPEKPGLTWFDNLQVFQDEKLIYDNYFTAIRPGKVFPTIVKPPEILVGAWQRFKAGGLGEEITRARKL